MHPEQRWANGQHPTYDAFVIEVGVRRDHDGTVQSYKKLRSESDFETAQKLGPGGGLEEGSWALLTEGVRTETMLQLLVKLSNDPEFKKNLMAAENAPEDLIEKLAADTLEVTQRVLKEIVPGLAREAIEQVRDGLRSQQDG